MKDFHKNIGSNVLLFPSPPATESQSAIGPSSDASSHHRAEGAKIVNKSGESENCVIEFPLSERGPVLSVELPPPWSFIPENQKIGNWSRLAEKIRTYFDPDFKPELE